MLTNFDVFAAAGGQYKGIVRSAVVQVTDGSVNIDFGHVTGDPDVQAVEIVTADAPAP